MEIVIIVCITIVVITGIICYTTYRMKDVSKIEKSILDIEYSLNEVKSDLKFYNRLLNGFTESFNKKNIKQ